MTKSVSIRELARCTAQVVHRAAAGETLVVTEHDRPVALLVPLPVGRIPMDDRLVGESKLTPARSPAGVAGLLAITPYPAGRELDASTGVGPASPCPSERDP